MSPISFCVTLVWYYNWADNLFRSTEEVSLLLVAVYIILRTINRNNHSTLETSTSVDLLSRGCILESGKMDTTKRKASGEDEQLLGAAGGWTYTERNTRHRQPNSSTVCMRATRSDSD